MKVTFFVTIFALIWPPLHITLSVVSQLQLQRVGVQVVLPREVRLIVEAHVVVDEGDGHDEGDMPLAIRGDDLQQLRLGIKGELLFEVPHDVLQDIAVLRRRGLEAQGLHEQSLIFIIERVDRGGLSHEPPHEPIVPGAVG